jgi:hypothetical protein
MKNAFFTRAGMMAWLLVGIALRAEWSPRTLSLASFWPIVYGRFEP